MLLPLTEQFDVTILFPFFCFYNFRIFTVSIFSTPQIIGQTCSKIRLNLLMNNSIFLHHQFQTAIFHIYESRFYAHIWNNNKLISFLIVYSAKDSLQLITNLISSSILFLIFVGKSTWIVFGDVIITRFPSSIKC